MYPWTSIVDKCHVFMHNHPTGEGDLVGKKNHNLLDYKDMRHEPTVHG